MSEIADFLRARYTEARDTETRKQSVRGDLPFRWTAVYNQDDPHVMLGEFHRVGMDEFFEKYGESAADLDVLADLDAKLAIVSMYETADGHVKRGKEMGWPHNNHQVAAVAYHDVLKRLAQPFAGHPDHKGEEWAP